MPKSLNLGVITALVIAVGFALWTADNNDSPAKNTQNNLTPVTVLLDWFPNTNHTGLYVAQAKGWFAEAGLDVEIIQPGEGGSVEQIVAAGQADFGFSYQEAVTMARAQDLPVVSLAAVIQHNSSTFASLPQAGISDPADFTGKTYGGWGSPVEDAVLEAVMTQAGADPNQLETMTLGQTDFFNSIGRENDFQWIYYGWDGVEAARRELELNLIWLKDLDPALDYYTPVMITNEQHIAEQAQLVEDFMHGIQRGYVFAMDNPDESATLLSAANPELDAELVLASQRWLSEQYQADADYWGAQQTEVWSRYAEWLHERQLIERMIDPEAAFTNAFVER